MSRPLWRREDGGHQPTMQAPGVCSVCEQPRRAAVVVSHEGKRETVFCPEHSPAWATDPGTQFVVMLDGAGAFTVWVREGAAFDGEAVREISGAMMGLGNVWRQRERVAEQSAVGPWRALVVDGGLAAPRPPGAVFGQSLPLVKARLSKSRFKRRCVQCKADVENGADVYRADAKARNHRYGWTGGWTTTTVRDCIVCMSCVAVVEHDHANAAQVAVDIFADLLKKQVPG